MSTGGSINRYYCSIVQGLLLPVAMYWAHTHRRGGSDQQPAMCAHATRTPTDGKTFLSLRGFTPSLTSTVLRYYRVLIVQNTTGESVLVTETPGNCADTLTAVCFFGRDKQHHQLVSGEGHQQS